MPLPTRRAIRPDSRHHREARRQGLSRSGGRAAGRFWNLVGGLSLVAFVIAAITRIASAQPHAWVMPTMYISVAGLVISVIVTLLGLRG